MTRPESSPQEPGAITSYRDLRRATRGHTSQSLRGLYDRRYYERHVGSQELADLYFTSLGLAPTPFTEPPLELASITPDDRILDVGCGRGEIVFQSAARGAQATGIDFSAAAIAIADETRSKQSAEMRERVTFTQGNAESLPFEDRSFTKAFLLDVVEHLEKHELLHVLRELARVLRDDGTLIVHTSENRWNNTYGYWLLLALARLRRKQAPEQPAIANYQAVRSNPELDESKVLMHINEQSVLSLKLALLRAGFFSRVWLIEPNLGLGPQLTVSDRLKRTVFRLGNLKLLYGNHIFALATPRRSSWSAARNRLRRVSS
jgi:ubiquinone/menaquinone biosynthesis C-methylase UbiE